MNNSASSSLIPSAFGCCRCSDFSKSDRRRVLVVLSGKTKTDTVLKAKDALEQSNAKLLGALLNKKKMKKSEHYSY